MAILISKSKAQSKGAMTRQATANSTFIASLFFLEDAMKTCIKCHQDFEPTPSQLSKYFYWCLDCRGVYLRRWKYAHPLRPEQIIKYSEQKKLRSKITHKLWVSKPENQKKPCIYNKIHQLIKKGVITRQPCTTCGAEKTLAHHPDYSKPLLIVWLCTKCHSVTHGITKYISQ